MRLIDADALKEQFEETHQFYVFSWGGDFSKMPIRWKAACDELVNCIAEVVNAPTIDAVPHWIPCEERLPEQEEKAYLVYLEDGHVCDCKWWCLDPAFLKPTDHWRWDIFDIPQYSRVLAWMPLPEPYEGERSE